MVKSQTPSTNCPSHGLRNPTPENTRNNPTRTPNNAPYGNSEAAQNVAPSTASPGIFPATNSFPTPDPDYEDIARRIHAAVDGLGTDENAIYAALGQLNGDTKRVVGNQFRPQHYSTFAWSLNQLTTGKLGGRQWHVKT